MEIDAERTLEVPETEFLRTMPPGGVLHFWRGGGGGWGDPLDRPSDEVLADVLNQYVTAEGALRDYGVVISGQSVDEAATAAERAARRA